MLSTYQAEHKRRWSYVGLCCQHTQHHTIGVGLMLVYVVSTPSRTQEALVLRWFMFSTYPAEHKWRLSYVGLCCQHTQQNKRGVGPTLDYVSILSITQEGLVLCWFMLSTYPAEHKRRWSYVGLCCQHTQHHTIGVGPMLVYVVNIPSRTQEALVLCWFMLSTYQAEHKRRWSNVGLCCQHTQQNTRGVGPRLVYVVSTPIRTQEAFVLCWFVLSTHLAEHKKRWSHVGLCCQHT